MSLRYLSLTQLADLSGLKKGELKGLLELLDLRGVLDERDCTAPDSFLDSLGWRRRPSAATEGDR